MENPVIRIWMNKNNLHHPQTEIWMMEQIAMTCQINDDNHERMINLRTIKKKIKNDLKLNLIRADKKGKKTAIHKKVKNQKNNHQKIKNNPNNNDL